MLGEPTAHERTISLSSAHKIVPNHCGIVVHGAARLQHRFGYGLSNRVDAKPFTPA